MRVTYRNVPAAPVVEDLEIYPRLIQLGACLQAELDRSNIPAQLVILSGGSVALDYCGGRDCSNQAWVRLVTATPYGNFPDPPEGPARCSLTIGYQLEVGFAHCAPRMNGDRPPAPEEHLEATRMQMAGMSAMLRAIRCCANGDSDVPWSLGEYVPGEEDGGCIVSTWSVTVGDRLDG